MARPIVGIIGNQYIIDDRYPTHTSGRINVAAVAEVAGCLPLIIPSDPRYVSVAELMAACDGFLLTGGRPNVHPEEYGEAATEAHGAFDRARDAITLPLVRACVESGQPFFGICRGFQEVNVALGGTLHPEIRELPGRDNHRMPPDGTMEEQFAPRHQRGHRLHLHARQLVVAGAQHRAQQLRPQRGPRRHRLLPLCDPAGQRRTAVCAKCQVCGSDPGKSCMMSSIEDLRKIPEQMMH